MENWVGLALGAVQGISDAISNGFRMAIEKDKEQTNRLIVRNQHNEIYTDQINDLATDVNNAKYITLFLIFGLFIYLLYTKKIKK
jgi:hypothetical protein